MTRALVHGMRAQDVAGATQDRMLREFGELARQSYELLEAYWQRYVLSYSPAPASPGWCS